MAEIAAVDPVKLNITRRQSISSENHINRIRSRRLTDVFFSKEGANFSQNMSPVLSQNDENMKQEVSKSIFDNRRKNHKTCVPAESLEELYENKPRQSSTVTHGTAEKRRQSSTILNPDIIRRRSISQENHINRIRSGNSRRLLERLSSKEVVNAQKNFDVNRNSYRNEENKSREFSKSDINNRRKSHQKSVPAEGLEKFNKNENKQSFVETDQFSGKRKSSTSMTPVIARRQNISEENDINDILSEKSRRSSFVSSKPGSSRKQKNTPMKNVKIETNKSRKTSIVKTQKSANPGKKLSRNPSVSNTTTEIRQTIKIPAPKTGQSTSIKNEQLPKSNKQPNSSSQDKTVNLGQESEQISDDENILTSNDTHSSKDIIILSWRHGISGSLTDKNRRSSISPEIKKSTQKLSKSNMKEKFQGNTKPTGLKNREKSPTTKEKNPVTENIEKSTDKHPETQKSETDSTIEVSKEVSDVDMHISEQGKLQIIFDAKFISPEDAAIVIWLDDIPETFLPPGFSRRRGDAPKSDPEEPERFTGVIVSHSASKLEDIPSSKPDICFPPVTILKNIAVEPKFGIRRLSMDDENSVYYKRCNLVHPEWELNGESNFVQPEPPEDL